MTCIWNALSPFLCILIASWNLYINWGSIKCFPSRLHYTRKHTLVQFNDLMVWQVLWNWTWLVKYNMTLITLGNKYLLLELIYITKNWKIFVFAPLKEKYAISTVVWDWKLSTLRTLVRTNDPWKLRAVMSHYNSYLLFGLQKGRMTFGDSHTFGGGIKYLRTISK